MASLKGKTLFISGGSRGIGLEIALRAARDGANVAIAAKTTEPNPKLPGTIFESAKAIESAGGRALALQVDIRYEEQVAEAARKVAEAFGGIDILINNASAINLTPALQTPPKRWDLMLDINARGTFVCGQACHPYLAKAENPHILTLSPPIDLSPKWFARHLPYTISKYAMSMCTLGFAEEFRKDGIAANSLWPTTVIATAALQMIPGIDPARDCRKAAIVADAAHAILTRPARETTGRFFTDEQALREIGASDFSAYQMAPNSVPKKDLFL
jgi:citronellol/citronellal dehydrogenase